MRKDQGWGRGGGEEKGGVDGKIIPLRADSLFKKVGI